MSFEEECEAFFKTLGEAKKMVLATCSQNRTTARMMSCIILNEKFYFQTEKSLLKYSQICKNPLVALCTENIQVEGKCRILGRPLENNPFAQSFEKHYAGSFKNYSHMENEVLCEATPSLITLWCYDEHGKPFRKFYNFVDETYNIQYYNDNI